MYPQDIIDLYNDFIDCCNQPNQPKCGFGESSPKERYDRYETITNDAEAMRVRLNSGGSINIKTDIKFLTELILIYRNGIAKAGQGSISENGFTDLVSDANFIKSLEEVIKNPRGATGERLLDDIVRVRSQETVKEKRLIVNRIIAASTEEVSAVVSNKQFAQVFKALVLNAIITNGGYDINSKIKTITEWYGRNVHMVDELRILIKKAINAEPDPTALSKLPWLWIEKNPNPNR